MISNRLKIAGDYAKGFNCIADCGTDHGYLPIYVIKSNYTKTAIASDNKSQPLEMAKKNIKQNDLTEKIETYLVDGLGYLQDKPEVDVVSILGMGGVLIKEILSKAHLGKVKRLILSPNSHPETVRSFLQANNWKLIDECFIIENKKYYTILVAEKGKMDLKEVEKHFGPFLMKKKQPIYLEFLNKQHEKLKHAYAHVKANQEKLLIKKSMLLLEEALNEFN